MVITMPVLTILRAPVRDETPTPLFPRVSVHFDCCKNNENDLLHIVIVKVY